MRWKLALLLPALLAAQLAFAAERKVTDDAGRQVSVPERAERIVVLHDAVLGTAVLDLGGHLVGSYGRTDDGKLTTAVDFIDSVLGGKYPKPPGIGPIGRIDLEKLRALKPDLIIGTDRDGDKVSQLSTVAPVYLQNVTSGKTTGFGVEQHLAGVLGREPEFDAHRQAYLAEIGKLRSGATEEKTYLAVIVTDKINLIGVMSGAIQALEDLGYRRAEITGSGAGRGLGSLFAAPLSPEALGAANPDLLILMGSYAGNERSKGAIDARLDRIMPGWQRFLKPAREGRVLYLDSAEVATPTIASAELTLKAYAAWAQDRPKP